MLAEIRGLNEECGVFGVWGHEEAPQITYYGLHSLQHRGQEGAGIIATDGENLTSHKGLGLITEVFQNGELKDLKGKVRLDTFGMRQQVEAALKMCSPSSSVRKTMAALPLLIMET